MAQKTRRWGRSVWKERSSSRFLALARYSSGWLLEAFVTLQPQQCSKLHDFSDQMVSRAYIPTTVSDQEHLLCGCSQFHAGADEKIRHLEGRGRAWSPTQLAKSTSSRDSTCLDRARTRGAVMQQRGRSRARISSPVAASQTDGFTQFSAGQISSARVSLQHDAVTQQAVASAPRFPP